MNAASSPRGAGSLAVGLFCQQRTEGKQKSNGEKTAGDRIFSFGSILTVIRPWSTTLRWFVENLVGGSESGLLGTGIVSWFKKRLEWRTMNAKFGFALSCGRVHAPRTVFGFAPAAIERNYVHRHRVSPA
jgi:hypothetical protein